MQIINNPTTNIAGCSPCTPEARQRTDFENPTEDLHHLALQLAREKARRFADAHRRDRLYMALSACH